MNGLRYRAELMLKTENKDGLLGINRRQHYLNDNVTPKLACNTHWAINGGFWSDSQATPRCGLSWQNAHPLADPGEGHLGT